MNKKRLIALGMTVVLTMGALTGCGSASSVAGSKESVEITNVSYDPTRELYKEYNQIFGNYWK